MIQLKNELFAIGKKICFGRYFLRRNIKIKQTNMLAETVNIE
tara:strand:+ start:322 stop:447 length:126 start_codon:yes stop_codon:yes gene_type:complete